MSEDIPKNVDITSNDIPVAIEDIMHTAYMQYSLSVNVGRAIPDVRDGLKPGNRRILYAMKQLGLTKSHAYTKCAKVVGEVIGNYHPHGDQSVYDTMVRMAQDFSMSSPLIDGQGNFGSIDGDSAAAYRYTECRLERLAEELLQDLDRDTVDMSLNFDETTKEPNVLPARFPNLLVNGTTGIGVGMATNIPPHNITEVINATIAMIDNPQVTVHELMQIMPGPDFPTGAQIRGVQSIIKLYETGHGIIKIRGKAEIIETKQGRERIIITEIPYSVNKETMVKKIADLVNAKKITGISGLNDESSSRVGIRVVIDIKRNAIGEVVLNQLYKHTMLATSFGGHLLVVDRNRPKVMTLRQILQAYIDHRFEVITRRTRFELAKAEARAHILEGLLIAVDNVDEVVKIIRASRTRDEACNALKVRFELSEKQVRAILDMRLHQLTGLARETLQGEYDDLMEKITYYKDLLSSRQKLMQVVRTELIEVRDKYIQPRRTTIVAGDQELNIEDLVAQSVWVMTISNEGYIKRVPEDTYRTQRRGGVGVKGMDTKEEDYVKHLFTAKTHDYVMFFTNKGQMHWLKTYEIPEAGRTARGRAFVNLIEMQPDEKIQAIIAVPEVDVENCNIVMATKNGIIKKTALKAFKNMRRKGIIAISLDEGDDLINAKLTDGHQQIILSSVAGRACRFEESDVRACGRTARGVRGMELRDKDGNQVTELVDMNIVNPNADLFVITAKGYGKRTHLGVGNSAGDKDIIGGYRLTKRGGKGVNSIKLTTGDKVVSVLQLEENEDIIMTSIQGLMVRIHTEGIRPIGRSSKGVRIMKLRDGDSISTVSKVAQLSEDEMPKGERNENSEQTEIEAKEAGVETESTTPITDANSENTQTTNSSQVVDLANKAMQEAENAEPTTEEEQQ